MQTLHASFLKRVLDATVMAFLLQVFPAYSAQPASGVKWYAGLDLGDFQGQSIVAWREALSRPWRLGGEPVTFMVGNGGDRTMVDRCDKLFPAVDAGLRADGTDQAIFEGWVVGCEAVRLLVDAATTQSDSMGDFPLDEKHVCSLPAGMGSRYRVNPSARLQRLRLPAVRCAITPVAWNCRPSVIRRIDRLLFMAREVNRNCCPSSRREISITMASTIC